MIDLNYSKAKQTEEDTPVGIQILVLLPFVIMFWVGLGCLL